MFERKLVVSGHPVTLNPYTEKRFEALEAVAKKIDDYVQEHPGITFQEIDRDKKAEWWAEKAEVLWTPDRAYPEGFFKSKDFELSKLKESEDFFLKYVTYL